MFYAPFFISIGALIVAFVVVSMDGTVQKQIKDEK